MIKKLTQREQYAIFAALSVIVLFIGLQFIVGPAFDKRKRLDKALRVKAKNLEQMIALKSEHDAIMQRTDLSKSYLANREKGFTLFSFLDRLSGKAGIKDHITYMKPSSTVQKNSPYKTSRVEMKLQDLTLQQLTAYLYMVETSKNMVTVKRLTISKTGAQADYINAVLQVETLESQGV
jgi:general secretion pathway protein M